VTPLVINFATDSFTGWGQVGTQWIGLLPPDYQPLFGVLPTHNHFVGMDPLRYMRINQALEDSRAFNSTTDLHGAIWVDPIGNDLKPVSNVTAKCKIGRVVIEKADLKEAMQKLAYYDLLLTGSTWNQERLEAATGRPVKCIPEGIDPSVFCPGNKGGWFRDTFNVYSCGKVEFRKAQDVTLMAFKAFAERHDDARLVTLWNSPFADLANGYKGITDAPLWLDAQGQLDVKRWAKDNGIPPEKVLELRNIPNFSLPQVLREMDVMLAPTRVESCTSLPVKEAMACGVPVIVGYHSGMLDLNQCSHLYRLIHHKPIKASSEYFFPLADWEWYEPDLEEVLESLEQVYQDRHRWRVHGELGSQWIRTHRTWEIHVKALKAWLKSSI
jgi:glycosyltransferase involved in cell wall biosynthesis